MPTFWSRNDNCNGAPRVLDKRCRSADSRRAAEIQSRLRHNHDSSLTELSAAHMKNDSCYTGNADTVSIGDELMNFQDENSQGAKTENPCSDVKVLQYKVENGLLKELLRSRTHDLREKCSALSICETELAEALISQTADDNCVKGRQIHKLARELKDRLCYSEMQMKLLREERDQAALDLTSLSGKMTTCTTIAEEQAKLLKGQLDTIRKFEKKIQILEKQLQEMRAGHKQTVHSYESSMQDMRLKHKERLQHYENDMQDMEVKHKEEIQNLELNMQEMQAGHKQCIKHFECWDFPSSRTAVGPGAFQEIQVLEKSMHDMRAGYKEEWAALEEQLGLHQQRAALQDRKIQKYHHELDVARAEISQARTREAELEDQLRAQTTICQDTTMELCAATKEIEEINNVSDELREQEERMEQLWVDNARLVQLLAESDKYDNLFHEMQGGKGLVFCPSHFKTSKFQSLARRYGAGSTYGPINPKSEHDHWIPTELYDLMMAFRKQHCLGVGIEAVQELLRIVTTFWRVRHRKIVGEVKLKHDKQMVDLRRQLSQRLPYEQVVQSSHSRPAKNVAQSKAFKQASPAPRGDPFCLPEKYGPTRDVDDYRAPATRRGNANDRSRAYKIRDREVADAHSPFSSREVYNKHRGVSPAGKGRDRIARTSPASFNTRRDVDDGHPGTFGTRGEIDADQDDFYLNRGGVARKNRTSHTKMGGVAGDYHGSNAPPKEKGNRQRGPNKHRDLVAAREEVVCPSPKKPKKGCLRGFVPGLCLGEDQTREKLSPARIASSPGDDQYPSTSDGSFDRDSPRRRLYAAKDDPDGLKSCFSGSSSV